MKLFGNKKKANHLSNEKKRIVKPILIIAGCLLVLLGIGYTALRLYIKPLDIKTQILQGAEKTAPTVKKTKVRLNVETGEEETVETDEPASHLPGIYNILLCGTDNDGYRTDTIIVAHMDAKQHTAALLSIPRDTVVENEKGGIRKINSVYAGGKEQGMQRLSDTLSQMLGFEMDGYILVDLDAFKQAVDLVGGVWFDVPQDMFYEDASQDLFIDLKQGYQLLDGEHAMELVRFRKGYASQDIQRTKVQQEFLLALCDQTIRVQSLAKIKSYAKLFYDYVITDMEVGNLLYFAEQLNKCSEDDIKTFTAEGKGMTINGVSYYPLYDWSLYEIVNEAFNPYDGRIAQENIRVITPDTALTYDERYEAPEDEQPAEQTEDSQPPDQSTDVTENWDGGLTVENLERYEREQRGIDDDDWYDDDWYDDDYDDDDWYYDDYDDYDE